MSKLTEILKQTVSVNKIEKVKPQQIIAEEKKVSSTSREVTKSKTEGLEFNITDEELELVKASVAEIEIEGKTRNEIIIGKYGRIKDPKTGKRFVIPGLTYEDENYIFNYANMMRLLINNTEDFKKIMRWE